jgi:hypothetical protein
MISQPTSESNSRKHSGLEMFATRIPSELVHQIKQFALDNKTTVQAVTAKALRHHISKRGKRVAA